MNKKAQIASVAFFIMLLAGIIIIAPIILRVGISAIDKTSTQLSAIDGTNKSVQLVVYTKNKITGTFDWVIMFLVILNILILLISSFLIDIHPAFLVIYIIGAFVMVITLPYTMALAEKIYSNSEFASGSNNVVQYIPMTEFMLNNFGTIIVGIIVLSGIIMFAKIKYGNQNMGGQSAY